MINEKRDIAKALETPLRTCLPEQDSPGPRAIIQRNRPPRSASRAAADGSRSPRFIARPSALRQFGNCRRTRRAAGNGWSNKSQSAGRSCPTFVHRELVLLSSRSGWSQRCHRAFNKPASGKTWVLRRAIDEGIVAKVILPACPYDPLVKARKYFFTSPKPREGPPSIVVTGRILGPEHSRRDPCTEISP